MNLELNLVKTQSIYSKVGSLLDRRRVLVGNDSEAMAAISSFIADNTETFDAALSNKALVSQLQDLKNLTIDELYSLKYVFASSGIDLIIMAVSDIEVNENMIPEGIIEYNVIDNLNNVSNFIKFATKIPVSSEGGVLTEMYSKVVEIHGLFEGDLFQGFQNPLEAQIGILRQTEQALGVTPSSITTYLNSVLEYLGKDIYVITA